LELIRHARDVKDKNRNRNVLRAVSFVISTQNRKAAVPRALETLSSLYNLLLSENDKEMQMLIIQGIETIAKTGQHTPQNIDLIMAMLSALKKKDVPEELLLDAILAVSSYSCYVQAGRNYPDVLVKTLLDEAVSRPPRSRAIVLAILQKLVKTQKRNIVSTTEDETPQANTTLASLSKKQQKELHYCLHRSSALKDNEPQNYVRIYRTLRTLWKRYRNADIAESVPMILTLQAAAKEMEGAQARAIHTLCAAYFTLLVQAYNNNDLGKYVSGIIEARLESKQINKNFVTLISKVNAVSGSHMSSASGVSVDSVVIDIEGSPVDRGQRKKQRDDWYNQLEQIFTYAKDEDQPVSSDNLFDKDKIVDLLSKIESLQSSLGEEITEILSKNFSGDMSVSQPKPELEDEPRWDNNLDEGTDTSVNEAPDNIHEEIPSEKAIDFEKHSFADIGQNASAKTQKMTQALDEILALVPASEGDQDHSLISEIEEEENIEGDAEGEVREMVGEKGKQKGRVMQHVPKLYLFDAPEYVM
jgi:Holliday junction resolvasome RuvABC endonuclease subunit